MIGFAIEQEVIAVLIILVTVLDKLGQPQHHCEEHVSTEVDLIHQMLEQKSTVSSARVRQMRQAIQGTDLDVLGRYASYEKTSSTP